MGTLISLAVCALGAWMLYSGWKTPFIPKADNPNQTVKEAREEMENMTMEELQSKQKRLVKTHIGNSMGKVFKLAFGAIILMFGILALFLG